MDLVDILLLEILGVQIGGDEGYFYLPYEFFTCGFAFDFWSIDY